MSKFLPNNVIRVPCDKDTFFRYWLNFIEPFHHLTDRELDVATEFLKQKHNLSKVILDGSILEKMLMGEDVQKEIRTASNLNNQHFQCIKGKLKAKGFFKNGKINDRLIPHLRDEEEVFQLLLVFEIKKNNTNDIQTDNSLDSEGK